MTKTQSKLTMTQSGQKTKSVKHMKLQAPEQPQKEKHLVHWFRKGQETCARHVNFHVFHEKFESFT
jgi:hypothetical protein